MPEDYSKCRDAIERLIRLEEKHEGALKALGLQAAEYERRLDLLNHAHTKHEQFQATFVNREMFASYADKIEIQLDRHSKELSELRGATAGQSSFRHLVFEIITLVIAAVAIATTIYIATT